MSTYVTRLAAKRMIVFAALAPLVAGGAACSSSSDVDSEQLQGADEGSAATVSEELSAGVPIGSVLATTANLNLRTGPSASDKILHVIPKGAQVTTVRAAASAGWYNIKHNGVVGWASGAYLKLVSSGGGGGGNAARNAAIARGKAGLGFSYWWGHGRWLASGPASSTKGSCSGVCGTTSGCTHHGSYGADCSGYVAKIWQVPSSNSNLAVDSHPYSTDHFFNRTISWHAVSRAAISSGDALVHHSGGSGHIMLYLSRDGWGSVDVYEAKGCAYGIVHDRRPVSTAYKAIARNGY
jgi:hypothetical protein